MRNTAVPFEFDIVSSPAANIEVNDPRGLPRAPRPCFCFNLLGGTSPIPPFLKLQNGVNELTSAGLMFAFISTDEKCDIRAVGDCYYQRATYLHWNRIACIQERGGLGLCDEFFAGKHAWNEKDLCGTLLVCMAKLYQSTYNFLLIAFLVMYKPFFLSHTGGDFTQLALQYIKISGSVCHWNSQLLLNIQKAATSLNAWYLWTFLCFFCRKGKFPFSLQLYYSFSFDSGNYL